MGVAPSEDLRSSGPSGVGLTPGSETGSLAPTFRVQAAFMIGGSLIGILGVVLPHPDSFLVPQLVTLNILSIVLAAGVWALADKLPAWVAQAGPPLGTLACTLAVILSRDATSAYALLFLFPGVYAYYFLAPREAAANIAFAIANYAAAIGVLESLADATLVSEQSVIHHFVVTVGMIAVVGLMLLYLRRRVDGLVGEIIAGARSDLQTGLLNMRGLVEGLEGELERARMSGLRVSLLTVRITGMTGVRSRLGHAAADALMVEIARLLGDSTRMVDTVARTSATEFAVILVETDELTGLMVGEQILSRLRGAYREVGATSASSVGVACFPKHAASGEALMQAAGAAAEAAQTLGSDRAVVFSAELGDVLHGDPTEALDQRRSNLSTVLNLAEVLEMRDSRTIAHSLMVSRYAEMMGRDLGLPEPRLGRLRLAGMLHDIGKVGISDSILDKPGPLSPHEWEEVRRHPEMAARILGARDLADIREWVLAKHEQLDGHGYPRGISGDEIPIESRILAVAEAFDAMTNDRPYRSAMSREDAITELGRYSGTQFDGAVVETMVRVAEAFAAEGDTARAD